MSRTIEKNCSLTVGSPAITSHERNSRHWRQPRASISLEPMPPGGVSRPRATARQTRKEAQAPSIPVAIFSATAQRYGGNASIDQPYFPINTCN